MFQGKYLVCSVGMWEYQVAWEIFCFVELGNMVCCIGCLIFYFGYREYIFVVCLFGGMDGENGLLLNLDKQKHLYIFFICYGTISSIYREMMFLRYVFFFSSSELVMILYCSKMFYMVSTILWCPHFPHWL